MATMSLRFASLPRAESGAHVIHANSTSAADRTCSAQMLVDELQARAFDFDLQVQLCMDLDAMPVNDATVEWPEKLSPFVTVGRVHLPRQDISEPDESRQRVTRWRSTSGASRQTTGHSARSCRCDASTARRPRFGGRSTTSRKPSPPAQMRCCPHRSSNSKANPQSAGMSNAVAPTSSSRAASRSTRSTRSTPWPMSPSPGPDRGDQTRPGPEGAVRCRGPNRCARLHRPLQSCALDRWASAAGARRGDDGARA